MLITNHDKTNKIIKHFAGRKPEVQAVVAKVENKTLTFSPEDHVQVQVEFDSNKNRIKEGDKISIAVESGEITLVERAAKVKASPEPKTTAPKESSTRGCSSAKAFAKERR